VLKLKFTRNQYPKLRDKILFTSQREDFSILLESNGFKDTYGRFDWIAALGARQVLEPQRNHFLTLKEYHQSRNTWLFGHLNYNLKNELENLQTSSQDELEFPLMLFFEPEIVIYAKGHYIFVESETLTDKNDFDRWVADLAPASTPTTTPLKLLDKTSRAQYLENVESLKDHLQYGNIYEANYCIEFQGYASLHAPSVYEKLSQLSPAPFAAYYKCRDQHLMCASPERYMYKAGDQLVSQPIKGTAARAGNKAEDELLKKKLAESEKERSENVMIVDLVRNDLSRTASPGSVEVRELFGIYSYPAVHQMVSTISSKLSPSFHFSDALRYSFPMGSMTGAPKIKAMQLIDEHENFSRSLYSGSVGYITPEGDLDFNVVIRSLFYNARTCLVSARVGSAITIHCDAEKEYEECLLKADKLLKALS